MFVRGGSVQSTYPPGRFRLVGCSPPIPRVSAGGARDELLIAELRPGRVVDRDFFLRSAGGAPHPQKWGRSGVGLFVIVGSIPRASARVQEFFLSKVPFWFLSF